MRASERFYVFICIFVFACTRLKLCVDAYVCVCVCMCVHTCMGAYGSWGNKHKAMHQCRGLCSVLRSAFVQVVYALQGVSCVLIDKGLSQLGPSWSARAVAIRGSQWWDGSAGSVMRAHRQRIEPTWAILVCVCCGHSWLAVVGWLCRECDACSSTRD